MTRPAALALLAILAAAPAAAQGTSCRALAAELAELDRGGGANEAALARGAAELSRTIGVARGLGCDRPFVFFGGDPRCPELNERIARQRANLAALGSGAAVGRQSRRAGVRAAYERYCLGEPAAVPEARDLPPADLDDPAREDDEGGAPRRARASGRLVCVRSCDGYFFPLAATGGADPDAMCRALCPAAETEAYRLGGGGEIEGAASLSGRAYSELPRALAYRTGRDPACGCKREGETWAGALKEAEALLGARRSDVIVTEEQAEAMSRPVVPPAGRTGAPPRAPRRDARTPRPVEAGPPPGAE